MIYWKCDCGKIYPEEHLRNLEKNDLFITEIYLDDTDRWLKRVIEKKGTVSSYMSPEYMVCSKCEKVLYLHPAHTKDVEEAYKRGEIDMPTSIDELTPVEMPSFDPTPFIGKRVKIENVTVEESKNPAITHPHLRIESGVVTKLGEKDIRATKLLGLYAQAGPDGKPIVGWGAKSKTASYLAAFKAKTPRELIGKEVILQTQMAKDGRLYLTF